MALSLSHLLNYDIADIVQDVTPRDVALYALSIGYGQDPLDIGQLDFVDPVPTIRTVPSMALVLAYPGFWLGRADTGVDASRVVHAEQEITLQGPLPGVGRIRGRTRVTGLFNRGPGKGLALRSERALTDEASGASVALLRQMHFLLGDRCDEAPPLPAGEAEPLPQGEAPACLEAATRPEQALLYRLNGDMNPLHFNPSLARQAGFDRPILHGMASFGVVTRAVLASFGNGAEERVRSIRMRFRAPVFPGDTLRVELWPGGMLRASALERQSSVIDIGQVTLAGPTVQPQ